MSVRLRFWRRSCDPKKGVKAMGTRRLSLKAYAARGGFAAKSHSTTTEYRQLRRLKQFLAAFYYNVIATPIAPKETNMS